MAVDKSHLEKHRNQWRVRVKVPEAVRPSLGGNLYLKQGLGTGDLAVANLLKGDHVTRFKRMIEDARGNVVPGSLLDEARRLRNSRVHRKPEYDEVMDYASPSGPQVLLVQRDDEADAIVDRAEKIEKVDGELAARSFADVAFGRVTPIDDHLPDFILASAYRPKSVMDLRKAVGRLSEWLLRTKRTATLEAVSQIVAGQFMRGMVQSLGLSRKNAAKTVSFLRSYWNWLEEQGYRPSNSSPWIGKVPQPKPMARSVDAEHDGGKRPFTPDEMMALLQATSSQPYMADLIRIAALSGMRLEEIYLLRIRDCAHGIFSIRKGKTANSIRQVPIHSHLVATVERLTEGKSAETYLIDPDAKIIPKTDIRSAAASKAFSYYRRKLGLDERPNGKLKSNIDFHSLRRWFIQQARDALDRGAIGFTPWTIADVVGHDDEDMKGMLRLTMQRYAGPSAREARVACINSVSLPEKAAYSHS
jgi:integrase